jgi:hypothetical protein
MIPPEFTVIFVRELDLCWGELPQVTRPVGENGSFVVGIDDTPVVHTTVGMINHEWPTLTLYSIAFHLQELCAYVSRSNY